MNAAQDATQPLAAASPNASLKLGAGLKGLPTWRGMTSSARANALMKSCALPGMPRACSLQNRAGKGASVWVDCSGQDVSVRVGCSDQAQAALADGCVSAGVPGSANEVSAKE